MNNFGYYTMKEGNSRGMKPRFSDFCGITCLLSHIDFVNKTAKIIQLADWDLIRSRVYARTAIRFLISTGGRNLPKKRRVIFEPQKALRRQHKRKFHVQNTA